jgi:hypothetical protein
MVIITIDTNPHRPFVGVPFLARRGLGLRLERLHQRINQLIDGEACRSLAGRVFEDGPPSKHYVGPGRLSWYSSYNTGLNGVRTFELLYT